MNSERFFILPFNTTFPLSSLITDESTVVMLNSITLSSSFIFEYLFRFDLYVTFKCKLDNKDVVVKMFYDESRKNNEFEVLTFLLH